MCDVNPRFILTAALSVDHQAMLEMPDRKWLAKRLEELRDAAGVSNAKLAEAAGVSPQAAGQWFSTGKIKFITLARIAPLLNATIEEILWPGERVHALAKGERTEAPPEFTPVQLSLVQEFEVLTEEQQAELLDRVHLQAKQNRAAYEAVRKKHGWRESLADNEVAKHIAPAPRTSVSIRPAGRKAGA